MKQVEKRPGLSYGPGEMISVRSHMHAWWLAIALVAVLTRSLIPVGYMPDFGTHHAGLMPLRICTVNGFSIIDVPADKYGVQEKTAPKESPAHHANAPCDFAIGHIFGFVDSSAALSVVLAFTFLSLFACNGFSFSPRRYFGDMAARAPPIFS